MGLLLFYVYKLCCKNNHTTKKMVEKATNIMERIDKIIKTNGGYIRNQDLISGGIPTIYLSRYVKKNHLAKVAPGFYDLEKTICDLIRFRKHIDSEVFLKAIRNYSKRSDKDLNRLYRYSTIMGIEEKVAPIMEVCVNED